MSNIAKRFHHSVGGASLRAAAAVLTLAATTPPAPALAQTPPVKANVGDPAPALSLETLINAPEGASASWAAFKGKAVVLEFFATWCGPCLAAVPDINELAERYKDKPVVFISITSEDERAVRKMMEKTPLKTWVGLDGDRSTHNAFGVRLIPHTVVVDMTGEIVAVTAPKNLTIEAIDEVLEGRVPPIRNRRIEPEPPVHESESAYRRANTPGREPGDKEGKFPLVQVLIKPSQKSFGDETVSPGALTLDGVTLRDALDFAFGVGKRRVQTDLPTTLQRYTVVAAVPDAHKDEIKPTLQRAVEMAFNLSARYEVREDSLFVLEAPEGAPPGLKRSLEEGAEPSIQTEPGRLRVRAGSVKDLVEFLERELDGTVQDKSRLRAAYDFELTFTPNDADSLIEAVEKQLGLKLDARNRVDELLAVEASPAPPLDSLRWLDPDGRPAEWAPIREGYAALTFWSSACDPCIEVTEHLASLAAAMKDKAVRLAIVTEDAPDRLRAFMEQRPLRLWIGLDKDGAFRRALHVDDLPTTVFLDAARYGAAVTHPALLSEERLLHLVSGAENLLIPQRNEELAVMSLDDRSIRTDIRPNYWVMIKETDSQADALKLREDGWSGDGVMLHRMAALAFNESVARVAIRGGDAAKRYRFAIVPPPGRSDLKGMMLIDALEMAFELTPTREQADRPAWVMTASDSQAVKLKRAEPAKEGAPSQPPSAGRPTTGATGGARQLVGRGQTIGVLARQLEDALGQVVVDETGLKEVYDWQIEIDPRKPEEVLAHVQDATGLTLTRGTRQVTVLIAEVADAPKRVKRR